MTPRVFVTGGSGFVGSAVVEELLGRGCEVVALSHRGDVPGARVVRGDIFDRDALAKGMAGCAAVIHLIGIIREKPSAGVTFDACIPRRRAK